MTRSSQSHSSTQDPEMSVDGVEQATKKLYEYAGRIYVGLAYFNTLVNAINRGSVIQHARHIITDAINCFWNGGGMGPCHVKLDKGNIDPNTSSMIRRLYNMNKLPQNDNIKKFITAARTAFEELANGTNIPTRIIEKLNGLEEKPNIASFSASEFQITVSDNDIFENSAQIASNASDYMREFLVTIKLVDRLRDIIKPFVQKTNQNRIHYVVAVGYHNALIKYFNGHILPNAALYDYLLTTGIYIKDSNDIQVNDINSRFFETKRGFDSVDSYARWLDNMEREKFFGDFGTTVFNESPGQIVQALINYETANTQRSVLTDYLRRLTLLTDQTSQPFSFPAYTEGVYLSNIYNPIHAFNVTAQSLKDDDVIKDTAFRDTLCELILFVNLITWHTEVVENASIISPFGIAAGILNQLFNYVKSNFTQKTSLWDNAFYALNPVYRVILNAIQDRKSSEVVKVTDGSELFIFYKAMQEIGGDSSTCWNNLITLYQNTSEDKFDNTFGLGDVAFKNEALNQAYIAFIATLNTKTANDEDNTTPMDATDQLTREPTPPLLTHSNMFTHNELIPRQHVSNFTTQVQRPDGRIYNRTYRERPADQLVTAMLGTACTGTERAPGCYQIPNVTNVRCTAENAVKGMCNFKTIAVPHESPVGSLSGETYRVYRSLDIGAQIKLQLQRAHVRYGYAAAILPVYCHAALDRHFSIVDSDMISDYVNVDGSSNFAREPLDVGFPLDFLVAEEEQVTTWLMAKATSAKLPGETPENYLRRTICPMYSRVLPHGNTIPRELVQPLVDNGATGFPNGGDVQNKFLQYEYEVGKSILAPFPIYWIGKNSEGNEVIIPNPTYLNSKYTDQNSTRRRRLMISRGVGMLQRAMQHLFNATVLYIYAAIKPIHERFPENAEEAYRSIAQSIQANGGDLVGLITANNVPRGAFAYLNDADLKVMRLLFILMCNPITISDPSNTENIFECSQEFWDKLMNVQIIFPSNSYAPWKPKQLEVDQPGAVHQRNALIIRRAAFLEALLSYWWDNNAMGKMRRRMNFRAKLANPQKTLEGAAQRMEQTRDIARNMQITADILSPSWKDAALYGLVIAHLQAITPRQTQPPADDMQV